MMNTSFNERNGYLNLSIYRVKVVAECDELVDRMGNIDFIFNNKCLIKQGTMYVYLEMLGYVDVLCSALSNARNRFMPHKLCDKEKGKEAKH